MKKIETPVLNGIEDWMLELQPEDLPSPYDDVARIGGIQAAFIIARKYGGMMQYFRKLDGPINDLRRKKVRAEFDGTNQRELARKYNRSETQIRTYLEDTVDERQTSLLDQLDQPQHPM